MSNKNTRNNPVTYYNPHFRDQLPIRGLPKNKQCMNGLTIDDFCSRKFQDWRLFL